MLEWEKCMWTALWPELPAPYYGDVIGALKENKMWPISQSFSIAKAFEHGQVVWDAVEMNQATRASTLKTQPFGAPFKPNVIPNGTLIEYSRPMARRCSQFAPEKFHRFRSFMHFHAEKVGFKQGYASCQNKTNEMCMLVKHRTQFLDRFSFHHFLAYWTYDLTSLNMTWSFSQKAKGRTGIMQIKLLDTTPSETKYLINKFHFVCIKDCCYYFLHGTNCCCGNGSGDLDLKFPLWAKPVAGKVAANLSEKGLLDRSCWFWGFLQGTRTHTHAYRLQGDDSL